MHKELTYWLRKLNGVEYDEKEAICIFEKTLENIIHSEYVLVTSDYDKACIVRLAYTCKDASILEKNVND